MSGKMSMDVTELEKALNILKEIPHLLSGDPASLPSGGLGIAALDRCQQQELQNVLKGFAANNGTASSAVSDWISQRARAIQTDSNALQGACSQLAGKLAASMNSYSGTDKYNADDVTKSGPDGSRGKG